MLFCVLMMILYGRSVQYDFERSVVECLDEIYGCIIVVGRGLGTVALVT